ncbi:hypothetical protein LPJ38_01645 [Bradyrhizobium daqingense]|nr:hypothetical protein [Bradyrhizobium daqingense]UFS89526.1 hypothetical protein LPJ38_01645 [Bradyrhizobium daqingense]
MSNREIREWLCSVGFKPAGMPEDDDEEPLRQFFEERSRFIVQHIPGHSEEDKEKRVRAMRYVVFASTHAATNTDFMIVREADGLLLFRLYNNRIERLQQGCELLLKELEASGPKQQMVGHIEVFEHALETPTIKGVVVTNRALYAIKHSRKDALIFSVSLILFIALGLLANTAIVQNSAAIAGHVDRFSTAMLTAMVLSVISVVHIYSTATPPIGWSLHYAAER